jgi:hypothetical protein
VKEAKGDIEIRRWSSRFGPAKVIGFEDVDGGFVAVEARVQRSGRVVLLFVAGPRQGEAERVLRGVLGSLATA